MVIEDEDPESDDSSSSSEEGDDNDELDSSESEDEDGLTAWDWIGAVGEQRAMEIGTSQVSTQGHTLLYVYG